MPRSSRAFTLLLFVCFALPTAAAAQARIKDIVDIEGIRDNHLVGYGLVVGLNGTGDDLGDSVFTRESLIGMLQRLGVNARNAGLDTDNLAAVMVTGDLPPFSGQGTRMDITVSALGSAESLLGGTLLVTPLMGADGEVYAVAQGPVSVGGFSAGGAAQDVVKNVPTKGRIPGGAIVEKQIDFDLGAMREVDLQLKNPDFTTSRRIAQAINRFTGRRTATSLDPATVNLKVGDQYESATALLTDIERLPVAVDQPARIVIDESSGTIVMGADVRVSTVAVAQGNLTVRVTETPQVSQPAPFAQQGQTAVVPRTDVEVDEDGENRMAVLPGSVTLNQLVDGLNALGVGPRDLISILQAIKASGALQAEIEVM